MRRMRQLACLLTLGVSVAAALAVTPIASAWTVSMTAQPKLKRTYHWSIEKTVSRSAVTLEAGKTTDLTYSVTVKSTGSTDSDWSVSGRVEMTEDPSVFVDWVRVTIEPDGTLATLDCMPATFPVALGLQGLECLYSAPLPNANSPRDAWMRAQQVNGNFRNVHTPFDFSTATVAAVDECVAVTDSMAGALGTVCAAGAPKTFTYTKTVGPYAKTQCGQQKIDNVASYLGSTSGATGSASASTTVTVTCPPPPPPPPPPCKDDHGKGDHGKGGKDDDHGKDDHGKGGKDDDHGKGGKDDDHGKDDHGKGNDKKH